nr:MAG TPA: hypothetical protein [Caudoviricetes sp.]
MKLFKVPIFRAFKNLALKFLTLIFYTPSHFYSLSAILSRAWHAKSSPHNGRVKYQHKSPSHKLSNGYAYTKFICIWRECRWRS